MIDTKSKMKPKYETPTVVPLGELARGTGYCTAGLSVGSGGYCSAGGTAGGEGGYCTAGNIASDYCTIGSAAGAGCTTGGGGT